MLHFNQVNVIPFLSAYSFICSVFCSLYPRNVIILIMSIESKDQTHLLLYTLNKVKWVENEIIRDNILLIDCFICSSASSSQPASQPTKLANWWKFLECAVSSRVKRTLYAYKMQQLFQFTTLFALLRQANDEDRQTVNSPVSWYSLKIHRAYCYYSPHRQSAPNRNHPDV